MPHPGCLCFLKQECWKTKEAYSHWWEDNPLGGHSIRFISMIIYYTSIISVLEWSRLVGSLKLMIVDIWFIAE
jgi:hypothetical protein